MRHDVKVFALEGHHRLSEKTLDLQNNIGHNGDFSNKINYNYLTGEL